MAHVITWAKFVCSYEGWGMSENVTLQPRISTMDKFTDRNISLEGVDLEHMNEVVADVLLPHVWVVCMATKIISQSVANILVDWYWEAGDYVFKTLRQYFNLPPGGMSEDLLNAINKANAIVFFYRLKSMRQDFYDEVAKKNPDFKKVKKQFLLRLDSLRFGAVLINTKPLQKIKFKDTDYEKYIF